MAYTENQHAIWIANILKMYKLVLRYQESGANLSDQTGKLREHTRIMNSHHVLGAHTRVWRFTSVLCGDDAPLSRNLLTAKYGKEIIHRRKTHTDLRFYLRDTWLTRGIRSSALGEGGSHGIFSSRQIKALCLAVWEPKDDMDDFSLHVQRYRPEELDKLAKTTKFSRKEIQLIYRGFKQECPTGLIDEEGFKGIFSQFFPLGDATHYAHYVFNTFTQNNQGQISFEDFLAALSTVSRGSTQEKLQWIFGLYDVNNDGLITKTEMVDVVTAIYEMMGRSTEPQVEETSAKEHVEKIFHLIDTNQDGAITIEELAEWVSRDDTIIQSLSMMDTVLYTHRDRGADGAPPPTRPSLSQP
ncbi:neuronal calcium sensor 1-like [Penaeus chinensis]|uniref:neuronal calcium sensor 1-like n=1 Tax=Penaeus chinensis TaxID=139456 RepID=UPI001FB5F354|nr:neuronal calcium sensor 1-like [Penaeus chinensis]